MKINIPLLLFTLSKIIFVCMFIYADFIEDNTLIFLSYYYILVDICVTYYYLFSEIDKSVMDYYIIRKDKQGE